MVTAFVLITVPVKRSGPVVKALRKFSEIKEAAAVYGETDIVAKVQAASLPELDRLIMEKIQGSPEVKSTRTFVAVEKLHWER
jgi:DNA-binding Lrp family transcriptional regulator